MEKRQQILLLGIDFGNTNIKCCLYNRKADLMYKSSISTKHAVRTWRIADQEITGLAPTQLWHIVKTGCCEIGNFLRKNSQYTLMCAAVSTGGCKVVCLDDLENPLYSIERFVLKTSSLFESYREKLSKEAYFRITGYPFELFNTGFYLSQLQALDPGTFEKIRRILSVGGYMSYKLTGELTSEYSTAASYGLWDYRKYDWWDELLDDLSLNKEVFGNLVSSGSFIGTIIPHIAEETGLPPDLKIYAGGHDYPCAAFALGCTEEKKILNISGTYEIIASFHQEPLNLKKEARCRTMVDTHVFPGAYSFMIEEAGASQTEWLRYVLGKENISSWSALFDELNNVADDADRREFIIPHILGSLFPQYQEHRFGAFFGVNRNSSQASLLKGIIDGLCFENRRVLSYQKEIVGEECDLIVCGGGSRNAFWMQRKADILGETVQVPKVHEASALGAALLAGVGNGVYANFKEASNISVSQGKTTFTPDRKKQEFFEKIFHDVYLPTLEFVEKIDDVYTSILQKGE